MSGPQVAAAIALAVIGLLLIVISAASRDFGRGNDGSFGDHLSKVGLFVGGAFMLPLVLILLTSIVVGMNVPVGP